EVDLERRLAEKRIYPAINLNKPSTRREELPIRPELLQKIWVLRTFMHDVDEVEATESILDETRAGEDYGEFFAMMKGGTAAPRAAGQPAQHGRHSRHAAVHGLMSSDTGCDAWRLDSSFLHGRPAMQEFLHSGRPTGHSLAGAR